MTVSGWMSFICWTQLPSVVICNVTVAQVVQTESMQKEYLKRINERWVISLLHRIQINVMSIILHFTTVHQCLITALVCSYGSYICDLHF